MNKAVFLDRDGVINELKYNKETDEFEPPFEVKDIKIIKGVTESLKKLSENDFRLFIVSNQPDYAKGKTTLENLKKVHDELHRILTKEGINFTAYYYCYHHPHGKIAEYTKVCGCRKPGTDFIYKAAEEFRIDITNSWIAGDRDTDIKCGKSAGLKTILINYSGSENYRADSQPDFRAENLSEAAEIILKKDRIKL